MPAFPMAAKTFGERYKHKAWTGSHSLCSGKYEYSRDDHGTCKKCNSGVKNFNLINSLV